MVNSTSPAVRVEESKKQNETNSKIDEGILAVVLVIVMVLILGFFYNRVQQRKRRREEAARKNLQEKSEVVEKSESEAKDLEEDSSDQLHSKRQTISWKH